MVIKKVKIKICFEHINDKNLPRLDAVVVEVAKSLEEQRYRLQYDL